MCFIREKTRLNSIKQDYNEYESTFGIFTKYFTCISRQKLCGHKKREALRSGPLKMWE
jgi:hypothetical protein